MITGGKVLDCLTSAEEAISSPSLHCHPGLDFKLNSEQVGKLNKKLRGSLA